jgi:outer membrane protein OmpA-like peptidoglycan-associated protein
MTARSRLAAAVLAGLLALGAHALPGGGPAALADEPIDITGRERIVDGLIPVTGAERDAPRLDLRIGFELNSAKLTQAGQRQLDELAQALATDRLAEIRVGLHGHTDASGPADYNLRLSERRAESARQYLVDRHGVDPARLEAAGFGERRLRPDLPAEAAGQRRVEVVNLTPERVRPAEDANASGREEAGGGGEATDDPDDGGTGEGGTGEGGSTAITQ